MTEWQDHVALATGINPALPQEAPFPVVQVPADYPPPRRHAGSSGAHAPAGGAGTRSEILLRAAAGRSGTVVHVPRMLVTTGVGATDVVLVRLSAAPAGFADVPFESGDTRAGRGVFRIQRKSLGGPTAGTQLGIFRIPTANQYVEVHPHLILVSGGSLGREGVVLRPGNDDQTVSVIVDYVELVKRAL